MEFSVSKQRDPDQTPHVAASDLFLHCLLISHKKDARNLYELMKTVHNATMSMCGKQTTTQVEAKFVLLRKSLPSLSM